jgi:hypothetical protein
MIEGTHTPSRTDVKLNSYVGETYRAGRAVVRVFSLYTLIIFSYPKIEHRFQRL